MACTHRLHAAPLSRLAAPSLSPPPPLDAPSGLGLAGPPPLTGGHGGPGGRAGAGPEPSAQHERGAAGAEAGGSLHVVLRRVHRARRAVRAAGGCVLRVACAAGVSICSGQGTVGPPCCKLAVSRRCPGAALLSGACCAACPPAGGGPLPLAAALPEPALRAVVRAASRCRHLLLQIHRRPQQQRTWFLGGGSRRASAMGGAQPGRLRPALPLRQHVESAPCGCPQVACSWC